MSTAEPEPRKVSESSGESEPPSPDEATTAESASDKEGTSESGSAGKSGTAAGSSGSARPSRSERAKGSERTKGSERPKEKAKRKEPLTEEEIDAPSRQTLIMLAVICLVTLISWAAGRAACNYHPPSESRTPRKVTLEDRTRTPKDVGIAFGQAIALGDFASAEKLTIGEAAEVLKKEKAACRDCAKRAESGKEALSVGVVLQANSVDTIVQVRTTGASFGEKVRILGIERKDRDWRVSRVFESAQAAKLNPPPPPVEAPPALAPEGTEGAATPPGPGEPGDSEGSGAQSAPGVVPPSGPPAQPAPED